jgi:hypothetical protein
MKNNGGVVPGGPSNWSVKFNRLSVDRQKLIDKFGHAVWMAARGTTNRNFSPLASPFTLRWIIGALRPIANPNAAVYWQRLDHLPARLTVNSSRKFIKTEFNDMQGFDYDKAKKIYKLMLDADANGIEMQSDISVAWGLGSPSGGVNHMSLTGLLASKKAVLPAYDYGFIFPPSQFL